MVTVILNKAGIGPFKDRTAKDYIGAKFMVLD